MHPQIAPARLAVRPGDVLLAVSGTQLGMLAELCLGPWGLGAPVPLRVMRRNRILELSGPPVDRMRWPWLEQSYLPALSRASGAAQREKIPAARDCLIGVGSCRGVATPTGLSRRAPCRSQRWQEGAR